MTVENDKLSKSIKRKNLMERTDFTSIVISLFIASGLTFYRPGIGIIYWSDMYVVLGMIISLYFILRREKDYEIRVKSILNLIFIGGILIGLDLTILSIFIAFTINSAYQYPLNLFFIWSVYIILTQLIIGGTVILSLYLQERSFS